MQAITYREKFIHRWIRIGSPGVFQLATLLLVFRHLEGSQLGTVLVLGTVAILATAAAFVYFTAAAVLNLNYLELDAEGLTLVAEGRHHRWHWWDLSSFELRESGLLSNRVVSRVNGRSGRAPVRPLLAFLIPGGHNIAFTDIYEAPLAVIACRLNDYRRQALGGATARQQAYA